MIRNSIGQKNIKEINPKIRVNKRIINSNSKLEHPKLSHQENNYFYNTKINRLVFQESSNNDIQNIYQYPSKIEDRESFEYFLLNGKENNYFFPKRTSENFYNNSSFKNLPIGIIKNNEIDFYNKDIHGLTCINFNNVFNDENFNNKRRDGENLSQTLRINTKDLNKRDIIKKIQLKKNVNNKYYDKNHNKMQILSFESKNNDQIRKSNIINKKKSPKIIIKLNKKNSDFKQFPYNHSQIFYKKKNDINKNDKSIFDKNDNKDRNTQNKKANNPIAYVYLKYNPLYNRSIEIIDREKKFKANRNQKQNISLELYDKKLLFKKLENFCQILEEIFFIWFKTNYNYFIQNLDLYNKNRKKLRAKILRRFDEVKKNKENKGNNSMIERKIKYYKYNDILNNERERKSFIENYNKVNNNNSPSKINEIQNNLTNSILKKNNNNKNIRIFNNIFKRDNFYNNITHSPLDEYKKTKIDDNFVLNSFYKSEKDNIYNDYNSNTNKFNKLKINIGIEPHKKYLMKEKTHKINHNKSSELITGNEIYLYNKGNINNNRSYKNKKNVNTRKNSCLNINKQINHIKSNINKSDLENNEIILNSNNYRSSILYSKPLQKKSEVNFLKKEKNNSMIKSKSNKRNNFITSINSNNIAINRSLNYRKNEIGLDNYDELEEIIIKNVSTEDKRLFVFIKYIPFIKNIKWIINESFDNNDLYVIHTDNIKIIQKKGNNNIQTKNYKHNRIYQNKVLYKGYSKDLNDENGYLLKNIEKNIDKNNYNKLYSSKDNISTAFKYLISLLQNIYNDNIKQVLYIFFKNLRKISRKTLFSSMKFGNSYIRLLKNAAQEYLNENFFQTELSNVTRNKIEENINNPLYNVSHSISTEKNVINSNSVIFDNNGGNKLKNENIINERNHYINEFDKQKEKTGELIKKKEKEKIEKKKLEKLEKIFNNLNKENNIINTIKKQFLDWTNKNRIKLISTLNNDFVNEDNSSKTKEYGVKTFDMKYLFKKGISENEIDDFEKIINIFRYKLISFSLNSNEK